MLNILKKYSNKIVGQGLSNVSDIMYLALDDRIYFYPSETQAVETKGAHLRKVFDLININSLLYAVPQDPCKGIITSMLKWGTAESESGRKIVPQDCETRTFFHDFPVIDRLDAGKIASALSERKSAVIADGPAVVSYGSVSAEQAFVSLSSTCFSLFVKYFFDFLLYVEDCNNAGTIAEKERMNEFSSIWSCVNKMPPFHRQGGSPL